MPSIRPARVIGIAHKPSSSISSTSPSPPVIIDPRRPALLSPSASSVSIDSQVSTSKSSVEDNDISAVVALQSRDNAAAASAGSRLVCPICTEEMVTLLQLNRHLDDDHGQLEQGEQEEVKNWFKTQMVKAKKFQPLAVINQKLKGLDRFESNEELRGAATTVSQVGSPARSSTPVAEPLKAIDSDDVVTRDHWQRSSRNDACSDPMCGKRLVGAVGHINCRKCGKLFCEEHTMYQMKLSRSAQHEPVRGFWCRVCETCYNSRNGYNDHSGTERNLMSSFANTRRKAVDQSYLDVSRLEKRLTKLTQLLADSAIRSEKPQGVVGYFKSFSGVSTSQRIAEQSVVDWEDDANVTRCPFCQQEFSNYSFRRHHCRLCGRVVCADLNTGCSGKIALDVESSMSPEAPVSHSSTDSVQITACLVRRAARYRLTYECVKTVNILSSARVISLGRLRTSPQINEHTRI
jgi:rabenosyn-5